MTVHPETWYTFEHWRAGQLLWVDHFHNLVTTAGKNKLLDATFKTGLAVPAWYVGLVDNAGWAAYDAADTMAAHGGWVEGTPYSNATRIAWTPGAVSAGSVDNTASPASFTINATLTVRGAFMVDVSTKGGGTGTLYGVGDLSVARAVISGDTLVIKATLTVN